MDEPGTAQLPLDWSGHAPLTEDPAVPQLPAAPAIPGPRRPGTPQAVPAVAPPSGLRPGTLARLVLARGRSRAAVALDVVDFVAACPACGRDCTWLSEREDTRVRFAIGCRCG